MKIGNFQARKQNRVRVIRRFSVASIPKRNATSPRKKNELRVPTIPLLSRTVRRAVGAFRSYARELFAAWPRFSPAVFRGASWGNFLTPDVDTVDKAWRYMRSHPSRLAFALWDVGEEQKGVFHNADSAWPLASTVKLVPLALACHRLESGIWREETPLSRVEGFYLPGTDGDAHPSAVAVTGGVCDVGSALTAMIEFSDNAATDALLFAIGRDALEREVSELGALEAPHPISGTMLLELDQGGSVSIQDAAWALAEGLASDPSRAPALAKGILGDAVGQLHMAAYDNRGTAHAFARLMEMFYADTSNRYELARQRLEWPLRRPGNEQRFRRWGAKGGSLPGVLTSTQFVELMDGRRRVLALFLRDLPLTVWLALSRSFAHQAVELEMLGADDPLSLVQARLGLEFVKGFTRPSTAPGASAARDR